MGDCENCVEIGVRLIAGDDPDDPVRIVPNDTGTITIGIEDLEVSQFVFGGAIERSEEMPNSCS